MIVIWECRLKAALIEETMREVAESFLKETPWYDVSTNTTHKNTSSQMVAEPAPEYKAEEE